MQLFFKEHFQLITFQKLKDCRLERKIILISSTTTKDLIEDTITIGPEGMINWVLQLNNSQSVNSFNSLLEKFNVFNSPNQPNPNPICDRSGNPGDTEHVFVDKGKTSRSHEIDEKRLHKELGYSNRSGEPERLSEDIRVKHAHDGTRQPVEPISSSTHIEKEQFAPEENRDIASFHAVNEFNRAIDEQNIDSNVPGVPNSTVKRSHGVNVQNLIQKIENHPQRQTLQSEFQQHRQFNHFSKESQDVMKADGNTELCELLDVEPKAQCKACLSCWDVGIFYCTCGHFLRDDTTEKKKYIKSVLDLFPIPNFYIRKCRPHGHRYGKKEGDQEYYTANQLKMKCKKRQFLSIHDRFIRDAWFRKTMIELGRTEEVIREMDKLANEDHTHIATEELNVYRSNWWIRSNFVGSDTKPIRHRPDFKEALSTLRRLKNAQDSWRHASSETSPRRWTQH